MSVVTEVPQACATPAPVPPRTTGARAPWRDSLLIGAIAAVLYSALSQSTLYGDAAWFLLRNDRDMLVLGTHCAYPLLLNALAGCTGLVGGSLYTAGMALSVAGGSVGCALMHRATALLEVGRGAAFRRFSGAFALCLLGYLTFTFLLLGEYPEYGAYLLPLVWPATLLALASIPRRILYGAVIAGLAMGLHMIARYDVPERGREYAAGVREQFGDHRVLLLVGDYVDLEARFVQMPQQPYFFILDVANLEPAVAETMLPQLEAHLRQEMQRYDRVVLTAGAERLMAVSAAVPQARTGSSVVLEFLRGRFRLEPVSSRGFVGYVLRP